MHPEDIRELIESVFGALLIFAGFIAIYIVI